jgi:hypothetical protein
VHTSTVYGRALFIASFSVGLILVLIASGASLISLMSSHELEPQSASTNVFGMLLDNMQFIVLMGMASVHLPKGILAFTSGFSWAATIVSFDPLYGTVLTFPSSTTGIERFAFAVGLRPYLLFQAVLSILGVVLVGLAISCFIMYRLHGRLYRAISARMQLHRPVDSFRRILRCKLEGSVIAFLQAGYFGFTVTACYYVSSRGTIDFRVLATIAMMVQEPHTIAPDERDCCSNWRITPAL